MKTPKLVSLALVATLAIAGLGVSAGSASAQWRGPRQPHVVVVRPAPPPVVVAPPYPVVVRPMPPPVVRRMERREIRREVRRDLRRGW